MKSHVYAGTTGVGQECIHKDDMIDAFRRTIDRRGKLPEKNEILVGEGHCDTYEALQNRLGELIHGEQEWATLSVPKRSEERRVGKGRRSRWWLCASKTSENGV